MEPLAVNHSSEAVTEWSAHRYWDNYAVLCSETGNCMGCEHNQQEAAAIASYLNNKNGGGYIVQHNTPDQVRRAAELLKGRTIERYRRREEAFIETGIWTKQKRRSR